MEKKKREFCQVRFLENSPVIGEVEGFGSVKETKNWKNGGSYQSYLQVVHNTVLIQNEEFRTILLTPQGWYVKGKAKYTMWFLKIDLGSEIMSDS